MSAVLMASRRSARVPLPVASSTSTLVRLLLAVKELSLFHVPKEKERVPVPVEAVSPE